MELTQFIQKWTGIEGGAERANYQLFLTEFCQALGINTAGPGSQGKLADYQFDGPVPGGAVSGATGFIDLYKRGSFILEAKQSRIPQDKRNQPELFDPKADAPQAPSGARYDKLMREALAQARRYATALPKEHPWPPFLIVCDVGRAFELYYDWSGNGRGYDFFPDKQHYRVALEQLTDTDIQNQFKAIWDNPKSIDPRAQAIDVTRHVSIQLAEVAKYLEDDQRYKRREAASVGMESQVIEETSLFLMRMLFCMFAEDVDLLPKDSFQTFLESCLPEDHSTNATSKVDEAKFERGLKDLWYKMGAPHLPDRWSFAIGDHVRYFNGGLFENQTTYRLSPNDLSKLIHAATYSWRKVEPAIFGTLLEQALTASERAKLGAHYTPRPYVERLVQATIMDVLEAEWAEVQAAVDAKGSKALKALKAFHAKMKAIRVLDPACGTGNFLYVSMELLLRLEGKVIELILTLGAKAESGIGPKNFYGLELNPRAAVIAELVLWIGWLRWRTKNDPASVPEPVLERYNTINFGQHNGYDAVLVRNSMGEVDYAAPMLPKWPEADFIVGNPPFIGGKDLRDKLGGAYAEALWKANPQVPKSADLVMHWWDHAADLLTRPGSPLQRFGFVTTNSITQEFSRRVIAGYMAPASPSPLEGEGGARADPFLSAWEGEGAVASEAPITPQPPHPNPPPQGGREKKAQVNTRIPLSLVLACPDHPWTKASKDAAAVRIAMTVAQAGHHQGSFVEVTAESDLDKDEPTIAVRKTSASINANLSIGSDVTHVAALKANDDISSRGVQLIGSGFIITPADAIILGLGKRDGLENHIRPYRNGRDMMQRSRNVMVIDLFGLSEKDVRQCYPEVYQHVLKTVKPEREIPRVVSYLDKWWEFGVPRQGLRNALLGLSRYIATVETSKHRIFQFLDAEILPDNMLVVIGSDDAFHHGVLSSAAHLEWCANSGGTLEDRPRYTKSLCFDPFPFPDATAAQRQTIADIAEELDATRKTVLADVPSLTMTELYNMRAARA